MSPSARLEFYRPDGKKHMYSLSWTNNAYITFYMKELFEEKGKT